MRLRQLQLFKVCGSIGSLTLGKLNKDENHIVCKGFIERCQASWGETLKNVPQMPA